VEGGTVTGETATFMKVTPPRVRLARNECQCNKQAPTKEFIRGIRDRRSVIRYVLDIPNEEDKYCPETRLVEDILSSSSITRFFMSVDPSNCWVSTISLPNKENIAYYGCSGPLTSLQLHGKFKPIVSAYGISDAQDDYILKKKSRIATVDHNIAVGVSL
jgi:hypothetical protein